MRVASLFAGIGSIDLAFEEAGHDIIWENEKVTDKKVINKLSALLSLMVLSILFVLLYNNTLQLEK